VRASHWRTRWPATALLAGVLLVGGAAAGHTLTGPPDHNFGAVPAAAPASAAVAARQGAASSHRAAAAPAQIPVAAIAAPIRLRIHAIAVDAPVVPVGVATGGTLNIPADPSVIGWWAGGGSPGQPTGTTVLVGHVDNAATGPGALFHLRDMRPGETITLQTGGRTYQYVVRAMRAYAKAGLPAAIFSQQVAARLAIVTCGGPFNPATRHYLDNIIAYAVPVRPAR
jgi:hypothetical protein